MTTCANCSSDALYVYEVVPGSGLPYCQRHLPSFLFPARDSGQLKTTEQFEAAAAAALEALAPKPKKKKDDSSEE